MVMKWSLPLLALAATALAGSAQAVPAMAVTRAAKSVVAKPAAPPAAVLEPEARAAIDRMGAYLRTLTSFEVVAEGYSEDIADNGQKVTVPGKLTYDVTVPDKLYAEISNDRTLRRFYFDGSKVTVDAPRPNLFAEAPLKGSIRDLITAADQKYGISFPLADLFTWGDTAHPVPPPTSGFLVGPETVGDVKVDHFAFRQPGIDWEIWITQGDKPLPLRIVMTNTASSARPQYGAKLTWTTNMPIPAERFSYVPRDGAGRIAIKPVDGSTGGTK